MQYYIVLITERRNPTCERHWIKCESLDEAKQVQNNYLQDNIYSAHIYELGDMIR